MDKFCEDCIHNEVCQYGAIPPHIGRCNDKDTLDDIRQDEWIPITFRQADDEEYEKTREVYDSYWADLPREECKVYDCRMPDDGQEVLITTSWGAVCEDTYHADDVLAGFEDHDDPDDVIAWMPKPEAYKKEDAE